jgi:hypothetical protein
MYLLENPNNLVNNKNLPFRYVSAPSGSGKTRAMVLQAIENVKRYNKTIIALPTVKLINEIINHDVYRKKLPKYKVFHHEVCEGSVSRELLKFAKTPVAQEQLIFVTHAALMQMQFLMKKVFSEWSLLIDEAPQIIQGYSFKLPETHNLITDHIRKVTKFNDTYSEITISSSLQKIADDNDREDEIFEMFGEQARLMCNQNWKTYVIDEHYEKLKNKEYDYLQTVHVLDAETFQRFQQTTIFSANFEETLCYQLWSAEGIKFVKDVELSKNSRNNKIFQSRRN